MNITINKRLTGRAVGDIICPMKSEKNSARVGTLFARQISCQIGRAILVILHNYFGNIYYTSAVNFETITLLIRWANQLTEDIICLNTHQL